MTRGPASCWRRSPGPQTLEVPTPFGGRTLNQDTQEMPALLHPVPGAGGTLLRSVSVCGRSVTFVVKFFPLITIIIIIIIIFIIIMNTVSHLSTPKNKLIHSLLCDANMVGQTCISFSPSPLQVLIHSFIHSSTAGIRVVAQTHRSKSVFINQLIN